MMRRNNRLALFARPGYQQLVANAGVEVGEAVPEDWFYSLQNTEWANQGHNGNRSLRINVANAMADWRTVLFPVVGGRRYRVGVWLKGTSTAQVVLAARWFSDIGGANYISEEWLVLDGVFADWTLRKHAIQAPANAVVCDLMFRAAFNTTADIYGDDFSVRRVN